MPKYVIVGACAAGIGAVEAIREVDPVGTLTVISEEQCSQYSRPMISDIVNYEKLLIATGGRPFVPKIEGLDKDGVFTFTALNDAERLAQKIDFLHAKKAVVIGAGLIGISVTEALLKRGLKVSLVELQEKILSLLLDPKASDIVEDIVKKAGVNIITGQSVHRIIGTPED